MLESVRALQQVIMSGNIDVDCFRQRCPKLLFSIAQANNLSTSELINLMKKGDFTYEDFEWSLDNLINNGHTRTFAYLNLERKYNKFVNSIKDKLC